MNATSNPAFEAACAKSRAGASTPVRAHREPSEETQWIDGYIFLS